MSTSCTGAMKTQGIKGFSSKQAQAFRTAFDHIDSASNVSTDLLQTAMKTINISLPPHRLRDVLYAVKENAIVERDVGFEEFVLLSLFLATYFKQLGDAVESTEVTKSASSTTALQMKLHCKEKPRNIPHVVSHYAAAVRLEGASEVQMAREVARLKKTSVKNNNSPYAELLILNYFNDRFFPHKRRMHNDSKLPPIETRRPNRDFQVQNDVSVKNTRPKTCPARPLVITENVAETKRPHSCISKLIDISATSPRIMKRRLKCTVKDYKFFPADSVSL